MEQNEAVLMAPLSLDSAAAIAAHLRSALEVIRPLMEARLAVADLAEEDSALDQAGLGDGAQIANEFLQVGEWGEAFQHLCYMAAEAQLLLPADAYAALEAAGTAMHFDVGRWQGKVTVLPYPEFVLASSPIR